MTEYAHPEVLVSTDWLAGHLQDPAVRVLEVDWDPASAYELGHVPGAALVDWKRDINDTVRRDILSAGAVRRPHGAARGDPADRAGALRRHAQLVRRLRLLDLPDPRPLPTCGCSTAAGASGSRRIDR